jgi:hypothetical protein
MHRQNNDIDGFVYICNFGQNLHLEARHHRGLKTTKSWPLSR